MRWSRRWSFRVLSLSTIVLAAQAVPARGDELWVAPTHQADLGGLGIGSNLLWPVTPVGVVRFAWGVPDNLQTFRNAKLVLIPHSPGGAATLNLLVCPAESGDTVVGDCAGPFASAFTGIANQLLEVDVSAAIAPHVGTPGQTSLAVVAFTAPTMVTDHIVGLRFVYESVPPSGVATLQANTFSGTQAAPAFVGSGAGLANVNAALLDGLDSAAFAAAAHGHDVSHVTNAARLAGGNTFTGTQTIVNGNLDLFHSIGGTGDLTKNGAPFLHNRGGPDGSNTFLGLFAGISATATGDQNVGVGYLALFNNTDGFLNTATGANALFSNTTGSGNTADGRRALLFNETGSFNTAIGLFALGSNTTGDSNTALGTGALFNNTTGESNVAVGVNAGLGASMGSNNIYLGAEVQGIATESNTMYLGKVGTQSKTFIAGVRGITTVNPDAITVMIDSAGQLGTVASSRRYKEDIHDMADASQRLFQLRPVTFRYTQAYGDGSKPAQFGLIAEEVAEVFPELAVRGDDGQVETVHYEKLSVLLLNELQRQERQMREVLDRLAVLEQSSLHD